MSSPGNKWNIIIPEIPFLSKYPRAATAVRGLLFATAAFLVGYAFQYMQAHNFQNAYIELSLPLIIPSLLVAILTFVWNIARKNALIAQAIDWVLEATNTAQVPDQLKQVASTKQLAKIEAVEASRVPQASMGTAPQAPR